MKQYTQVSTGLLLASLVLVGAGCMNKTAPVETEMPTPDAQMEEPAAAVEAGVYQAQAEQSLVEWYGEKRVGASHDGSVDLSYGQVTFDASGALVNGTFTIDMTTIDSYEDIAQLEGHLNSADFFDTENHGEATFVLTSAEMTAPTMYTITGDLTIKGITNEVTFPATITTEENGTVRAVATIEVDRASYDVRFGSPSFFTDLGDAIIEDTLKFKLNIVAMKVSDIGMMMEVSGTNEDMTDPAVENAMLEGDVDVMVEVAL